MRMDLRRIVLFLAVLTPFFPLRAQVSWRDRLAQDLVSMGEHNWIVVAEPAFPLPNSTGIVVMPTELSQTDLVTVVLNAVAAARHVRPSYYTATELPFVPEQDAIGIGSYRAQLAPMLKSGETQGLPEQELEAKLDAASRNYRVLVLKSTTLLPYSSLFIELRNGYWSPDAEKRLRAAMETKPAGQ